MSLLFMITIFFLSLMFYEIFTKIMLILVFRTLLSTNLQFLYAGVPRSSGMSRLCVLFFIIFNKLYLNYKFKYNFQRYSIYFLTVIFLFCTLHMQSRIVITFLLAYAFFNVLPFSNKKKFF